ncbi:MAG: type II toxin-antitoxin system Phd/YefM family antitoxin [bacterium]
MAAKKIEVGAFEAKTRLSELLRETERGTSFAIRRRGKVVALLIPPPPAGRPASLAQVLASFREVRRRVHGPVKIRELVEEGRRR